MERLRLALTEADVSRFKTAADQIGVDAVRLNVDRGAVQLVGCEGVVIAHFPISQQLLSQLSD